MVADDRKLELNGVDSVLLYKDAVDSNTYYYSSTRPSISTQNDEFALTMLRYDQPQNGSVGTLSFIVDLEPAEDELNLVRLALRKEDPKATLKPMPWTSGVVTAAVIGGDPVATTPSLIGRNSAVISMGLSLNQYLVLTNSLGTASSPPVSVVYKLSFDAYRKAYEYRIEFHQDKFRDWLQKKCSANFLFVSFEKVDTFEELRNSGVIEIVAVNATDSPAPDEFRRAFLQSLQSALTPLPQFAPPPEGGQSSWLIGFDCSTVHDIQNIQRSLDCNMQVSGAITRSVFIQGAVGNLAEAWKKNPPVVIPRGGLFKQNLTFRCFSALDSRPVQRVTVWVDGKYPYTHTFDSSSPLDWSQSLTWEAGGSPYSYRWQAAFGDPWRNAVPSAVPAMPVSRDQAFVDIVPASSYTYRRFIVSTAAEFPWELIKSVKVSLASNIQGVADADPVYLSSDKPISVLEFFASLPEAAGNLEFTALYTPAASNSFTQQGLPAGGTIFLNPFRRRKFTVRAADSFDWEQYPRVRVSVRLPAGIVGDTQTATLTKGSTPASWNFWSAESEATRIEYKTAFTSAQSPSPPAGNWKTAPGNSVTFNSPDASVLINPD